MDFAAAAVAWLGVSVVMLADGRRGLAVGMALATLGLGVLALLAAGPLAGAAIAIGGGAAAVRRATAGPPGWSIMPAGSTPRLVTCVAAGLLALWIGLAVTSGAGGAMRFTVMTVVGLAGARVLWSEEPAVIVTAVALVVMGIALGASMVPDAGPWPFAAAALVAVATALPLRTSRAA